MWGVIKLPCPILNNILTEPPLKYEHPMIYMGVITIPWIKRDEGLSNICLWKRPNVRMD